ncbi:glutamine-hydrolyzing GMP synthase [Anaerosalibacter massiliensis]|uniref:glutamine-hydrolyzing GMP synthase n=1 Tax=Anaerosalibacter massiliensis TaxID=1347392 RepID=UPI0005B2D7BD|nr:glutamine-hydrolyzing GMP synthase [Anaerosalibacter massiliensis]
MILILDFGGKCSRIAGRIVRESKVYCEIYPYDISMEKIKEKNPQGIIFTGNAKEEVNKEIFNLGIGIIGLDSKNNLLSEKYNIKTYENESYNDDTKKIIKDFLFEECKVKPYWDMKDFVDKSIKGIKEQIGNGKAICALSGGVDSSVAAVLVHEAIGDNLTCVFVDHGLLRKNEFEEVESFFREKYNMNLITVDAKDRFLNKLKGVTDPEKKRKIIGEEFIRVFEEEQSKLNDIDYLVQGTIYPDVIESGGDENAVVKSHHNVGGLPEDVNFELVEPLRQLFKDEVREVGTILGIPEEAVNRQPFPGPGLGVRVLGEITEEKLEIVREADYVFRDEIKKAGLHKEIWQYFAILPNIKSVGVYEGKRTYNYTIGLRAVYSIDGMTAQWAKIPLEVLEKISNRIVNEVDHVNRVVYDITSKPPSTIEWE